MMLEQIEELLNEDAPALADVESTLTDGYAQALELEGEKLRLERRVSEIAQRIDRGDAEADARELVLLAKSIDGNEGALARLRAQLAELRRYADRVRGRS